MYVLQKGKSWRSPISRRPPVTSLSWLNTSRWLMLLELSTIKKKIIWWIKSKSKTWRNSPNCPDSKVFPIVCICFKFMFTNPCGTSLVQIILWEYQLKCFSMVIFHKQERAFYFFSWILWFCVRDEGRSYDNREVVHMCRGQKITLRSQLPPSTVGPMVQTKSSGSWSKCLYSWAILLDQTYCFNSCNYTSALWSSMVAFLK